MKRREFISKATMIGVTAFAGGATTADAREMAHRQLPRRPYGKTGEELSIIGLGGVVVSQIEQAKANDIVAWAVDRGVNYFDVAPTYGNAQERLGPALAPYRDKCFLACKTAKRDALGARGELEESLTLLRTDYVDLYQLHGLTKVEEVEQVFAPDGAMETFVKAREEGKVRHIGFSAHSFEAASLAMDKFDFDSVLFPLNVVCMQNGNFGPRLIKKAQEKGVTLLAIKAMAWTRWPEGAERKYPKCWYQPQDDRRLARLCLAYTLDLPVAAAIPPGDGRLFELGVRLGQRYKPLTDEERADLLARVEGVTPIFAAG